MAQDQMAWLRSPWIFGAALVMVLVLGAAILLKIFQQAPPQPVAVQVAPQVQPEPAPAPAPATQRLLILGNGKLGLDGAPPQDLVEVFTKEFPMAGEHSVKVFTGLSGYLSFTFTSQEDQPAALKFTGDQDVLALLVSTSKDKNVIYSNRNLEDFSRLTEAPSATLVRRVSPCRRAWTIKITRWNGRKGKKLRIVKSRLTWRRR